MEYGRWNRMGCFSFLTLGKEKEQLTCSGLKRKSSSLSSDSQGYQGLACKAYVVSGSFVRQVGL